MIRGGSLIRCSEGQKDRSMETRKGREKKILLKSMHKKYQDVGGNRPYILCEFHLVDLETNEVQLGYLPPLLNCARDGLMLASDDVIYILGGLLPNDVNASHHFRQLLSNSPKSEETFYLGASRFDSQGGVWAPVPPSINHSSTTLYTVLFGKIYALGPRIHTPEVFDPALGHWKTLCAAPPELDGAFLSTALVPDPSSNRILLHFRHHLEHTLYAFTLPSDGDDAQSGGGTWERLASDFPYWINVAAVVDDVLFIFDPDCPSCVRAFDIARKTLLKACWTECFDNGLNLNEARLDFYALLPLRDKIFCLATWSPNYDFETRKPPTEIQVLFFKFTVERIGDTVNLIPLSTHALLLPDASEVFQFLGV